MMRGQREASRSWSQVARGWDPGTMEPEHLWVPERRQ